MNLREKLAALKAQQEKPVTTVIPKEIEMPEGTAEMPGAVIREKLRQLGNRKLVNPPPTDLFAEEQEAPVPVIDVGTRTAECEIKEVGLSVNVEQVPASSQPEKTADDICPTCGKAFKVLAKHKCKTTAVEVVPNVALQGTAKFLQNPSAGLEADEHAVEMPSNVPSDNPTDVDKELVAALAAGMKPTYVLLINCLPLNRTFTSAIDLAVPVMEAICKEHKVEHWSACPFGTGPGKLQTRFEAWLVLQKDFPTCITLDTQSLEAKALLDPLTKYAAVVIRGIR